MFDQITTYHEKSHNDTTIRINPVTQYVCVTELCQSNNKKFYDWYRLKDTQAFLESVSSVAGIPATDLLIVGTGNTETWAHPQVAIDIAAWCSVEMRVKITGWILELLTIGKVELQTKPLALLSHNDNDRISNMATSVASRSVARLDPEPKDKINLNGWLTVRELLEMLGERSDAPSSLTSDRKLRFWVNRQLPDVYRANNREEPPRILRGKSRAYCYPPSYKSFVSTYVTQWRDAKYQLSS
jgi:KilA-N domain